MAPLTETERTEILMMEGYDDRRRSNTEVAALFNETIDPSRDQEDQ